MEEKNQIQDERWLREAVLRGDEHAWHVLYDRCFDGIYAFIDYRTGHRRDTTEEIAQESWMVAVRRIRDYDPTRSSFETWLRGIAANIIRNHWRAEKGNKALTLHEDGVLGSVPARVLAADHALDPAAGLTTPGPVGGHDAGLDVAERIGLAMTALSARYQTVLRAKYQDDLPVTEIARQRGESPKAVESLLSRARSSFREVYNRLERGP